MIIIKILLAGTVTVIFLRPFERDEPPQPVGPDPEIWSPEKLDESERDE